MTSSLSLRILSPQATLLFLEDITMIVCPGVEGDLGIMVDHEPLITTLRTGTLKVMKNKDVVFAMDVYEEQRIVLNVSSKVVTMTMDIFCPIAFDYRIKGIEYLPPSIRVESRTYGSYRIETEVIHKMKERERTLIQDYLTHHKGASIFMDLFHDLLEKAVA